MQLSKLELFAIVVALFAGLHFYNQYKYDNETFGADGEDSAFYFDGEKPPVVVAFGDDLTAGTGTAKETNYPAELSKLLGVEVIDAGVPGETSKEALRRLPGVLRSNKPDIVIVEEGFNDILTGRKRSKLKENLEKMVRMIKDAGAQPVVVGLPDMDLIEMMIATDLDLYEEVARKYGALYIPDAVGPVLKDESLKSTETYPNAKGYRKIAENIYDYLGGFL